MFVWLAAGRPARSNNIFPSNRRALIRHKFSSARLNWLNSNRSHIRTRKPAFLKLTLFLAASPPILRQNAAPANRRWFRRRVQLASCYFKIDLMIRTTFWSGFMGVENINFIFRLDPALNHSRLQVMSLAGFSKSDESCYNLVFKKWPLSKKALLVLWFCEKSWYECLSRSSTY